MLCLIPFIIKNSNLFKLNFGTIYLLFKEILVNFFVIFPLTNIDHYVQIMETVCTNLGGHKKSIFSGKEQRKLFSSEKGFTNDTLADFCKYFFYGSLTHTFVIGETNITVTQGRLEGGNMPPPPT